MQEITSKENSLIKEGEKLLRHKKYRREQGEFVTEGLRLSLEAQSAFEKPLRVMVTGDALDRYGDALAPLLESGAPTFLVGGQAARKLGDTETPQGIFCFWPLPAEKRIPDRLPRGQYLYLDGLQDPGNIGTILRSSEAFGLSGLILSEDCPDLYSPKVLRATMGGVFRLPVYWGKDTAEEVRRLRKAGFRVLGAALSPESRGLTSVDLSGGVVVLIGNEGNGLSPRVMEACDGLVRIEMQGRAESLNAAVAASVIAWEMTRRRIG